MSEYFKKNYTLISINLLYALSMFLSISLVPSILVKTYGVSSHIISMSGFMFAASFFIGSAVAKEILKHKFNYFLMIRVVFLISVLFWVVLYFLAETGLIREYSFAYVLVRSIEGFVNSIIFQLINHFFFIKLMSNKKRVEILGLQSTIYYIVKAAAPVLAAVIITMYGELSIFLSSAIIAAIVYMMTYIKTRHMLNVYQRHIQKNVSKTQKRLKVSAIKVKKLWPNMEIFKGEELVKRFYSILFIHNSFRGFYDLFFVVFFTTVMDMSYVKSGFLFSVLISGQAFQYVGGKITVKMHKMFSKNGLFATNILIYTPTILQSIFFLYLIAAKPKIEGLLYVAVVVVVFSVGFSRAIHNAMIDYYMFEFSDKKKEFIQDYNGTKFFIADMGNLTGYIIAGAALLIGYKTLFVQMIVFMFILLYISKNKKETV